MIYPLRSLALSALLTVGLAGSAAAVTLDAPLEAPLVTTPQGMVDYSEMGTTASAIVTGTVTGFDGLAGFMSGDLYMFFEYDLGDPYTLTMPGAFQVLSDGQIRLSGMITEAGDIDNGLVLQLSGIGGTQADDFGTGPLATIVFADDLGGPVSSALGGMTSMTAEVLIGLPGSPMTSPGPTDPALEPVPLPGGLPLMLGAAAALGGLRLRRARKTAA